MIEFKISGCLYIIVLHHITTSYFCNMMWQHGRFLLNKQFYTNTYKLNFRDNVFFNFISIYSLDSLQNMAQNSWILWNEGIYQLCFGAALNISDCTNHFLQFFTLLTTISVKSIIHAKEFQFQYRLFICLIWWGHAWAVVIRADPGWSIRNCLSSRKSVHTWDLNWN